MSLPAGVIDELELQVPAHLWHQLVETLVHITRCCKHSQVLLMMGENIAENM
jgi:hypothetical protein